MKKQMIADMLEIKEKYAIPRKTVIADCGEVVVKKAQAVETEVAVLLDRFYYIKVVDANLYDKKKRRSTKTTVSHSNVKHRTCWCICR